jgi:hypothetical protein
MAALAAEGAHDVTVQVDHLHDPVTGLARGQRQPPIDAGDKTRENGRVGGRLADPLRPSREITRLGGISCIGRARGGGWTRGDHTAYPVPVARGLLLPCRDEA